MFFDCLKKARKGNIFIRNAVLQLILWFIFAFFKSGIFLEATSKFKVNCVYGYWILVYTFSGSLLMMSTFCGTNFLIPASTHGTTAPFEPWPPPKGAFTLLFPFGM